jgi:hypothetical protein
MGIQTPATITPTKKVQSINESQIDIDFITLFRHQTLNIVPNPSFCLKKGPLWDL